MIEVIKVEDRILGNQKAHDILKGMIDSQTLLVLSGGTSPDYDKIIVQPTDILPGAVAIGDERYGMPYHEGSNEFLFKKFGLNDFFSTKGIEYHRVLTGEELEKTAQEYNKTITNLFVRFNKKIGVMGVGADLHTSSIFPNTPAVGSHDYFIWQNVLDKHTSRLTLTIKALSEFTNFVILMFGSEKKEAIDKLLNPSENDVNKYPAVFYRTTPIKCFLISDQIEEKIA